MNKQIRFLREAARRSGAAILGTHYTGVRVEPEALGELLDYRQRISNMLQNELRSPQRVLMALAVVGQGPTLFGCNTAAEIAQFNVSARQRLSDALFILGRVEAFVWLCSVGATVKEAQTIMESDKHWRTAIKKLSVRTPEAQTILNPTEPADTSATYSTDATFETSELSKPKDKKPRRPRKTAHSRPLPPPQIDPITGKARRSHRIRKKATK